MIICRIKNYIQPFERLLALEELRALAKGGVTPLDGNEATASTFAVTESVDTEVLRHDLSYWEWVGSPNRLTAQVRSEATSIIARNGVALDDLSELVPSLVPSRLPNKRCLRYATHGLHEYRGKFFPQLVRAFMNMAQVPRHGIVLDPMCGSGTTLVEAILSNRSAYGLDMNPLSVFVTEVKCRALGLDVSTLLSAFTKLSRWLERPAPKLVRSSYLRSLPIEDQDYLSRWFAERTLQELDQVQAAINRLSDLTIQQFFLVSLSNILRGVSWQKCEDLRVRREIFILPKGEVVSRFLNEALRSTKTLAAFLAERGKVRLGQHNVTEGDARDAVRTLLSLTGRVDAIITSPPYATALPYVDTDRLSLVYLGLLARKQHRLRDTMMIGNREVTERARSGYWIQYEANKEELPAETCLLIERIDRLNKTSEVGFRRRNLSALLAKYFFDMRAVLEQLLVLLRPGGVVFMVVGNNRTTAGGQEVEIQTAFHLAQMAEMLGFRVSGSLPMDMLVSRDIFRKNAMSSEQILTLQKNQ